MSHILNRLLIGASVNRINKDLNSPDNIGISALLSSTANRLLEAMNPSNFLVRMRMWSPPRHLLSRTRYQEGHKRGVTIQVCHFRGGGTFRGHKLHCSGEDESDHLSLSGSISKTEGIAARMVDTPGEVLLNSGGADSDEGRSTRYWNPVRGCRTPDSFNILITVRAASRLLNLVSPPIVISRLMFGLCLCFHIHGARRTRYPRSFVQFTVHAFLPNNFKIGYQDDASVFLSEIFL